MSLPEGYAARVTAQLGQAEARRYLDALEMLYTRGLRLNPRKPAPLPDGVLDAIPWEPMGRYLSLDSLAGSQPLHEAGAYYLQEPSAMIPARVLAPKANEIVLDLCAAPGGKSTQLAALMQGGLLVCNEPVPSRAQILSRNIERMGISNALVVSESPDKLAALWEGMFDAVLVDAPCSGEGMFRRHPETRLEWNAQSPQGCAQRQRSILESALRLLKDGGRIVYSTCTHSPEEDEQMVEALLSAHPELAALPFCVKLDGGELRNAENGMAHFWPHQLRGEGHFVALMQKQSGTERETHLIDPAQALSKPDKALLTAYRAFCEEAGGQIPCEPTAQFGQSLLSVHALPPLSGVKTLRAGVMLGQLKGKVFDPDHALALALPDPCVFRTFAVDYYSARAYQAGETLPCDESLRGYVLLTHEGLELGFGKASQGQIKNHYPKGLRKAIHMAKE